MKSTTIKTLPNPTHSTNGIIATARPLGLALGLLGLLLAPLGAAAATVKGVGEVTSETRLVEAFDGVSVAIPAEVTYVRGEEHSVTITAQGNLIEHIEVAVSGRRLHVKTADNLRTRQPIKLVVVAPALSAVSLAGSGEFTTDEILSGAKVIFELAGSGQLTATVETERLVAQIAGSGKMALAGTAGAAELSIAGSGDFKAGALKVAKAAVEIAGSGRAEVHAQEALKVEIAGSGRVLHSGDAEAEVRIIGSGTVKRLQH